MASPHVTVQSGPKWLSSPPPHTGSPGPRNQEESKKNPERVPGAAPKAPKECPGVSKESEKSPKVRLDSFGTLGRTLSGLLGPFPRGTLSGLFLDSSRAPRKTLCGARPIAANWDCFCSFGPCRGIARNAPRALGGYSCHVSRCKGTVRIRF